MSALEQQADRELAKVTDFARRSRASKPAPAFTAVDLSNLTTATLPEAAYAVANLLPRGHVSLLGAHGGAGKTILAETLCAHVACGRTWADLNVANGRVVYASLEDPADVVRVRLKRIVHTYGLDAALIERNLLVLDGTAGTGVLASETGTPGLRTFGETSAFSELALHAADAVLVVVDNASDAFDGNENDRRHVRAFMRLLGQLARENNAAVLLLAHVDKNAAKFGAAGNSYSGSTAWHNSARSRLALVENNGVVEMRQEKNNLARLAEPISLTWNVDGVLVPSGGAVAAKPSG